MNGFNSIDGYILSTPISRLFSSGRYFRAPWSLYRERSIVVLSVHTFAYPLALSSPSLRPCPISCVHEVWQIQAGQVSRGEPRGPGGADRALPSGKRKNFPLELLRQEVWGCTIASCPIAFKHCIFNAETHDGRNTKNLKRLRNKFAVSERLISKSQAQNLKSLF